MIADVGRILTDLKPCPFCGGQAGRRFHIDMTYAYDECIIQCTQCKARIEIEGINELSELGKMAIEKWNKRVRNRMIIEVFKIDGGVNKYVVTIDATQPECELLTAEGYCRWSRYKSTKPEYEGQEEELWVK